MRPKSLFCILRETVEISEPWCLPATEEAGLNPPITLMYAKPNNANIFKNNYYDRYINVMVLLIQFSHVHETVRCKIITVGA